MKVECVQEKLQAALSQAEKVVGKNVTLPVLSCILLEAGKGELGIRATNLDLGFQTTIPAKVEEGGILAVPGQALSSFVANMFGEKSVKLSANAGNLLVATPKSRTTIKCLPYEDFPTLPKLPEDQRFEIEPVDFAKGLKAVWYSASVSSVKPELSSVFVYGDQGDLVFAATDSFRLAEKRVKMRSGKDFERVLIPFRNVAEIVRMLESAEKSVIVHAGKHQIAFVSGTTTLTSRLIDGTFPDYRQIIPKDFKTEATVLKDDLLRSLKIATIFSDAFNQAGIAVSPKEKRFEVTTKNNALGESTTALSAALTGEPAESNFNYRYIADCLQSIGSDSVSLSFAGPARPLVIRGIADRSFTYLVMPMNR